MKRRIFLGLIPICILIAAMGVYAVILFSKLGVSVDVILRENFRSVLAGQQMKEAAERMDSAMFFSIIGEEERGRGLYVQNLPVFQNAIKAELNNVTLPGEEHLAQELKKLFDTYTARADVFWKMTEVSDRREMYFGEMLPAFTRIKDSAQEIISINQDNMLMADRDARELSARSTRYMIVASIAGIIAAIFFAIRLQRAILQPIQILTAVSKELGEGKLDQVVPVDSRDELGQLGDAFNKMAAKLRAYRQVTSDQIVQARQMTEDTFAAFPDPIFALAPNRSISFMNPAATLMFQKLGSVARLPAAVMQQGEQVLLGGVDYLPTSFEKAVVVRIDDREVFLLPRVIGMRDESGKVFGAAVILQDVTRLRLLDEVKSNLVSTVSHELKTPLTSVRMGLHLLLEERVGSLNAKQVELLLAAREDSERLLGMINDLLDLAKLESGNVYLHRETVEAAAILKTVQRDQEAVVESRGIRLVTRAAPGLAKVTIDFRQIGHVFSNLISNAAKHSRRGEEIVVTAGMQGGKVRFSVTDQGDGIAEEYQARIFDRFFRVPGENSTGAGLGLAIAREIVTAHGGSIGVRSKPGEGSEFYFDLPATQQEGVS